MSKRKKRGISIGVCLLLCAVCGFASLALEGVLMAGGGGSTLDDTEEIPETVPVRAPLLLSSDDSSAMNINAETDADVNGDGITIEHIYGGTYEGYMMVVEDPEDVFIAINPGMSSGAAGPELDWYVENFNAVGGINGGGFEDYDGNGDGSIPAGIVIMDGKLVSGGSAQPIVGITAEHKLICTTCTGEQALNMGIVEAVTFGPTLIEDGEVVYTTQTSLNMLNPRTAIGQKEDGTFLLLVIDGRGPSSFGAKYEDIVEIMLDYGAVNASNLDGGNSSVMIYNGQYVHYPVSMYNSRNLPSVILVKGDE